MSRSNDETSRSNNSPLTSSRRPRTSKCETPSSKYRVEDPNPLTLWRAQSPVHPTLPRRAANRTWNGTVREKNPLTASLTGPGRAGKQGELLGQKGSKYVGEVLAGRPHGQGQYLVPKDGLAGELVIQFEGTWIQGRREGQGTRLYPTDEYYTGEWVSNLRHGQGRYVFGSGDVYSGGWMDDKRSGPGTYYYKNGDIFVGGFAKDRKEGMGTLYMMTRQRKYIAEYIANNPKCGTVLELDDTDLEPLRGQLQSLALQRKLDLVSKGHAPHHLPPCQLEQPNKVLAGEVVEVRRRREAGGKMLAALQEASGTLGQRQVEMLRHSFVLMAAGDDLKVGLLPHQLRELTVMAGMDPSSQATWALVEQLLGRKDPRTSRISYDSFLQVVLHFQDAAVLQPVQQDPPSTGGNSIMEAVAAAAEAAAFAADCTGTGSEGDATARSFDDAESRGRFSNRFVEEKWGGPESGPSTAGGEGEFEGAAEHEDGQQHGMAAVAEGDGEEEFVEEENDDSAGEETQGEEEEQQQQQEEEEQFDDFEELRIGAARGRGDYMADADTLLAQSVEQDFLATMSRVGKRESEMTTESVPEPEDPDFGINFALEDIGEGVAEEDSSKLGSTAAENSEALVADGHSAPDAAAGTGGLADAMVQLSAVVSEISQQDVLGVVETGDAGAPSVEPVVGEGGGAEHPAGELQHAEAEQAEAVPAAHDSPTEEASLVTMPEPVVGGGETGVAENVAT